MVLNALLLGLLPSLTVGPDQPSINSKSVLPYAIQDGAATDPSWKGNVLLSLIDTRGNTKNQSAALLAKAVYEQKVSRYTVDFYWLYSKNRVESTGEDELTERKAGLGLQYDYLAGEDYFYILSAAIETDTLSGLDLRYRAGAGIGYDYIKSEKFDLSLELGLNYIDEEFNDNESSDAVALNFGYDWQYRLNERTTFDQAFDIYPAIDDFEDVYFRLSSSASTKVSESMMASLSSVFDYDNTPAASASRRDHRLLISLGWTFGG
jgi:putative salt-induced outer membrane protein YdiY